LAQMPDIAADETDFLFVLRPPNFTHQVFG
jgi:hypothetical protein